MAEFFISQSNERSRKSNKAKTDRGKKSHFGWEHVLTELSKAGFGSPDSILDTMSPDQMMLHYEILLQDYHKKLADELIIQRQAYHAKDIKKFHKKLERASKPKSFTSPEEFLRVMQSLGVPIID